MIRSAAYRSPGVQGDRQGRRSARDWSAPQCAQPLRRSSGGLVRWRHAGPTTAAIAERVLDGRRSSRMSC